MVVDDDAHSEIEARRFALGKTDTGRLLMIVFTIRVDQVRVISARPMSRRERSVYGEAQDAEGTPAVPE